MSFLKILVYLQTGYLGGSLQWTVQWMHLKAHSASKDVSGKYALKKECVSKLQNGSYQLHVRLFNPRISQIFVFCKFCVQVAWGSLHWSLQWKHLKAHNTITKCEQRYFLGK